MIRYLLKTTEEYRLETLDEVVSFRKWLYQDGSSQGYDINSFGYVEKAIKEKGEYIDSYYVVKVQKKFDDEKDPVNFNNGVVYTTLTSDAGINGDKNENI
jgi:hypothetical protein